MMCNELFLSSKEAFEETKGGTTNFGTTWNPNQEHICFMEWVDLSVNGGSDSKRLFVITQKGLYFLLEPQSKPCW